MLQLSRPICAPQIGFSFCSCKHKPDPLECELSLQDSLVSSRLGVPFVKVHANFYSFPTMHRVVCRDKTISRQPTKTTICLNYAYSNPESR